MNFSSLFLGSSKKVLHSLSIRGRFSIVSHSLASTQVLFCFPSLQELHCVQLQSSLHLPPKDSEISQEAKHSKSSGKSASPSPSLSKPSPHSGSLVTTKLGLNPNLSGK